MHDEILRPSFFVSTHRTADCNPPLLINQMQIRGFDKFGNASDLMLGLVHFRFQSLEGSFRKELNVLQFIDLAVSIPILFFEAFFGDG